MKPSFNFIFCLAVTLYGIGQVLYFYPSLPDQIATHFNAAGEADGWESKENWAYLQGGFIVMMFSFFFVLALFMKKIPTKFVNMPNREYWLAPEREKETRSKIISMLWGCAATTMAFLVLLFQHVLHANIESIANHENVQIGSGIWIMTLIYLGVLGVWVTKWYFSVRKVPA